MPGPLSSTMIDPPFVTVTEMIGAISASSQASMPLSVSSFRITNSHCRNIVAGLVDQFAAGAEFHQPRHHKRDTLQSLLPLSRGRLLTFGLALICKIRACRGSVFSLLNRLDGGNLGRRRGWGGGCHARPRPFKRMGGAAPGSLQVLLVSSQRPAGCAAAGRARR